MFYIPRGAAGGGNEPRALDQAEIIVFMPPHGLL